ncbi:MAG TPA: type IV pilus modification protein PilV [Burkholderiaceae bacterium]|nr:type IV pilus modification protein PilV [Burkholderiaceae bacterium]
MPCKSHLPAARGVVLIEVLVGLLIFVVGVLGIIGLQAKALQYSVQSEDRSRAALLANDLVALMWANGTTSLPEATLNAWRARLTNAATGLPDARATISDPDANGLVTITITWKAVSRTSDSDANNKYQTTVVLTQTSAPRP